MRPGQRHDEPADTATPRAWLRHVYWIGGGSDCPFLSEFKAMDMDQRWLK
jgi:hypothetical protein